MSMTIHGGTPVVPLPFVPGGDPSGRPTLAAHVADFADPHRTLLLAKQVRVVPELPEDLSGYNDRDLVVVTSTGGLYYVDAAAFPVSLAPVSPAFVLLPATASALGGVKQGPGTSIAADGTISVVHQPLDSLVDGGSYDSATRKILLKHGSSVVAEIDASAFVRDGMVSSASVSGGSLVISFNTDAGKSPVSIPLTSIFNPSDYYDRTAADAAFVAKEQGKGLSSNDYTSEDRARVAGALSRAEAEAGFTEWVFSPATFEYKVCSAAYESDEWYLYLDGHMTEQTYPSPEDATSLSFMDGSITATRTRLAKYDDLPAVPVKAVKRNGTALTPDSDGAVDVTVPTQPSDIGAQSALGYTAENSANKVTAFSSPTDTQYPSAKLVKDSLDERPTKSQLDAGWWSEWEPEETPSDFSLEEVRWIGNLGVFVVTVEYDGNTYDAIEAQADGGEDSATVLAFTYAGGQGRVVRHRVAAPVPTKPSDIGAQAALSEQQLTNIAAVPGKQDAIDDLADIRAGAAAGATAVQPNALAGAVRYDMKALTSADQTGAWMFSGGSSGVEWDVQYDADNVMGSGVGWWLINESEGGITTAFISADESAKTLAFSNGVTATRSYALPDRACGSLTVAAPVSPATEASAAFQLPAAVSGKIRDCELSLTFGSAATDTGTLTASFIDPATGDAPIVDFGADSLGDIAIGRNLVMFSECGTANHWLVKVLHEDFPAT